GGFGLVFDRGAPCRRVSVRPGGRKRGARGEVAYSALRACVRRPLVVRLEASFALWPRWKLRSRCGQAGSFVRVVVRLEASFALWSGWKVRSRCGDAGSSFPRVGRRGGGWPR